MSTAARKLDMEELLVLTDCPTLLHGQAGPTVTGTYRVDGWVISGPTPDYYHLRPALGGAYVAILPEWLAEHSNPADENVRGGVLMQRLRALGYDGSTGLIHPDGGVSLTLASETDAEGLLDELERAARRGEGER